MKKFSYENRKQYLNIQIKRSREKFPYCKVYFSDVIRYARWLHEDQKYRETAIDVNSIVCLGVRSGAEIDIFRTVFFSPLMQLTSFQSLAGRLDRSKLSAKKIRLTKFLDLSRLAGSAKRVKGVEINPDAERPDVHIGSFDELPDCWGGKYSLLYTNSFDHSIDPNRTITEWKRVCAPGGYILIAFAADTETTAEDPLGGITITKLIDLFQLPVVFASETVNRAGYHEICFHLPA